MQLTKDFKIAVVKGLIIGITLNIIVIGSLVAIYHRFYERIPSLVGLNYYSDVEDRLRYKHLSFHITEVPTSQDPVGTIIQQTPEEKQMIARAGNDIYITIAAPKETMKMPDVVNLSCNIAQLSLKSYDAEIVMIPQMSMSKEFGTVLRTEPVAGQTVSPGSTITIYYASDEDLVEVPNLIGYNVNTAKKLLESVGLTLDPHYEYVNSSKRKGAIVYQSFDKTKKIPLGWSVSVKISTGTTDPVTTTITIKLPKEKTNRTQPVNIYLNNDKIYSKNLLIDGSDYSFSISGRGTANTVKVVIDGSDYYTCKVNFTQSPAKITDSQYLNPSAFNIPGVTKAPSSTVASVESTQVSQENTSVSQDPSSIVTEPGTQPYETTTTTTSIFDIFFR